MNLITLGLLLTSLSALAGPPAAVVAPVPPSTIEFLTNRGQWEKPVLFAANVPGGSLFLTPGRLVQARYDAAAVEAVHDRVRSASAPIKAHAYGVTFVGANAQAAVQGEAQRSAHTSFFLGNDPKKWASNVPAYGAVRYQALYPGTDLRFYTHDNQVEYDFELAAGADATQIRLQYDGQESLNVKDGALHIATSVGTVVEQRPYAYQLRDGRPEAVACAYVLGANHTVSFVLPRGYDHSRPLVIDPVLVYASYTGSPANNWGYSSTYDAQGNLYCGGIAFSLGFPATVGAYSTSFAGTHDIAIMKFNPSASTGAASMMYATYIGGANAEHPHSMLVDGAGNLLIYGTTSSSNYPTTAGAYDTSFNGGSDIVVTRLSATGSALLASTFVGGSAIDGQLPTTNLALYKNFSDGYRGDLTLDRTGNVYVASNTQSVDFPRIGGVQNALAGTRDAAVFKLTPSLAALQWSTFLGGTGEDAAYSIQLDSLNNVFVCGGTQSTNFPGTAGGLRPSYGGGTTDGFVSRIAAAGNVLTQSTYLGTSGYDQAYFIQLDRQGQVYILGQTDGIYPVSPGVYNNPNSLQFIHKIQPSLLTSSWSTVIGNGRASGLPTNISPTAFLVDDCSQILLSGFGGNISNMPVTANAIKPTPTNAGGGGVNGDFYIMQLSANAGQLVYGTYYGNGTLHVDGGASRFDKTGVIYQTVCINGGVGGVTPAITTPNAWAAAPGFSNRNALAFKMDILQLNANFVPAISASATVRQTNLCAPAQFFFNRPTTTGTRTLWDFGNGQTSTQANNATTIYNAPGRYAVRLTVFDINNCLQSVSAVDTVVVHAVPRAHVAPSSRQSICLGSSVVLSASNLATNTPAVTFTWTAPGQPTLTGAAVTVRPTVTTRYTVTISAAIGCTSTDTVTVHVQGRPLAADFVPSLTAGSLVRQNGRCAPAQFYFTRPIVTGTTAIWSFGNGQTSTQVNNVTASYTTPGKYPVRLTVTDPGGCTLLVTTVDTLVVYPVPQPRIAPAARQVVCAASAVTLQASNLTANMTNVTYTWTAAGQPTRTGPSITVSPAPNTSTRYTVTASTPASLGGCVGTDTITVRVRGRVVVSAGPARLICPNETVALSVADFGPNSTYTWTAPGQPTLAGRSVTVRPTASVRYLVRVVDPYGCPGLDSVQINVAPRPIVAATVSNPNLIDKPVFFTNTTTGATSYRWDFGDNTPPSTAVNPTHVYTTVATTTPYQARLTAIYGPGCEESINIPVSVRSFETPNIITPNGDNLNDTFRPFVTTEKVDIRIFNRWGRLAYEQKDYQGTWGDAGTAPGIYYYQLVSSSGKTWKGWVEVVK